MKALVLISILGVIALFAEMFKFKKQLFPVILLGLAAIFVVNIFDWNTNILHFKMMYFDNYAVAFTGLMLVIALLWFLMSGDYFKEATNLTDHYALILFSLAGAVIMVSFANLTMLFLGIETLSLSMYVLAGSKKSNIFSNESAFKYFLMGSFATGFLLFGFALIYGVTDSFDLHQIALYASHTKTFPIIYYTGILMIIVGLSFKASIVPFHFWAPDVYDGAPTVITSYMATIVKIAAFAAFFRLFSTCFATVPKVWVNVLFVFVLLTLLIGNVTAVFQTRVKRMLAYSSISHAGFMLMAIVAMDKFSASAILYYTAAYSVATIAAFLIMHKVEEASEKGDKITAFDGLSKSNPFLALTMTVAMLSLAGIPPTAGFFAKYFIFTTALQNGFVWLVIFAVIAALIGVYYYFKIIIAMYFKPAKHTAHSIDVSVFHKVLLIATIVITIVLGIFPDLLVNLLQ